MKIQLSPKKVKAFMKFNPPGDSFFSFFFSLFLYATVIVLASLLSLSLSRATQRKKVISFTVFIFIAGHVLKGSRDWRL